MPPDQSDTPTNGSQTLDQETREEPRITDPPAALWSRNPLAWFRFFGPGAILASVTVGSGEIVFPSRGAPSSATSFSGSTVSGLPTSTACPPCDDG